MRVLVSLGLVCSLVACGGAPELPPPDTMTVDFSSLEKDGALVEPYTHWGQAVVRVGLLSGWVGVGLAAPVLTYEAARSQRPRLDGDTWVWRFSVRKPLVDATATLTATPDGHGWRWAMRIDGRVGTTVLHDVLWYDGRNEGLEGHWQFYDGKARVLRIDWRRTAPLDRQLTFTNNSGGADDGDFLDYRVDGERATVAYDFGDTASAIIEWSLLTRAGFILADDWDEHPGEKACWDERLVDVVCEAP